MFPNIVEGDIEQEVMSDNIRSVAQSFVLEVLEGNYRFHGSIDVHGEFSQEQKLNIAESYLDIVQSARPENIELPEDYIPSIAVNADLDDDVIENSFHVLDEARRVGIDSYSKAEGYAAACLYTGAKLEQERNGRITTQEELAEAAGVSEGSVSDHFRGIEEAYDFGDFEFDF